MNHATPERAEMAMAENRWRPFLRLCQRWRKRYQPRNEMLDMIQDETSRMNEMDRLFHQDLRYRVATKGQPKTATNERETWNNPRKAIFGPSSDLTL